MRNLAKYRAMTVEQIMELEDDGERRDILETLIREHTTDENEEEVLVALERELEDEVEEELDRSDDDQVLTEFLERSTDEGLAKVLTKLMKAEPES